METNPYLDSNTIIEICGANNLLISCDDGAFYDYEFGICFKVNDNNMYCEGYLKLVEYLFPYISWLQAQKLYSLIEVSYKTKRDYYSEKKYAIWTIHINQFIDYALDELKIVPRIAIR